MNTVGNSLLIRDEEDTERYQLFAVDQDGEVELREYLNGMETFYVRFTPAEAEEIIRFLREATK